MTSGSGAPRPRRPAFLDPVAMEAVGSARSDPAVIAEIAHETAAILVRTGRAAEDPAVIERLVRLVEAVGLDALAELWADRPARSLPGALWRLYLLREWTRRDPVGASRDYAEGVQHADVAVAIAGVGTPPGPEQVQALADAVLHGVYDGDLALALERAAAFARVVASGRAGREPDEPAPSPSGSSPRSPQELSERHARSASAMLATADDLQACARLWRRGDLD